MSPSARNLTEPALIVTAFTVGCLINRRRVTRNDVEKQRLVTSAQSTRSSSPTGGELASEGERPESAQDEKLNLFSRFLRAFPFLMEIWYWNLTYWPYQLLRAWSATLLRGNKPVFDLAEQHALSILSFERRIGIAAELPLQQYIMTDQPWLMAVLARIYYSHICLGICFLIYTYTYYAPGTYRRIRRTIAINNAIAFCILTTWRCMPPRLLPEEYGFTDVLHGGSHGGSAWTSNKFQLTIAAMPSLHFGTSLFLAFCIVRFSPHRWLRAVAPLWPAAMLLTILATANHFILDAVVGSCVVALGWRINRAAMVFLPVQDTVCSWLGIKYPDDPYGRDASGAIEGTATTPVPAAEREARYLD